MAYIEGALTTERADLEARAVESIQTAMPDWEAVPGSLVTILIEAIALMAETQATDATEMLPLAFRYFGQDILGIPLSDGAPARAITSWTLSDTLGHTIAADTFITIEGQGFQVFEDVVVAPGASVAEVEVIAVEDGTAYNGLSVDAYPTDSLAWVQSIAVLGATFGGEDPQSDDEYQDALSDRLRLLADRVVLPADFEIAAKQLPGIERVVAIDGFDPGTNEVQTLTLTNATGGTFTLTYSGQTATGIVYNATAAQVKSALEGLSNINTHDVRCAGGPLMTAPVTIEFTGQFAATDVALMTTSAAGLTGATPTATVTTTTTRVASAISQERMVALAAIDSTGAPLSAALKTELATFLDAKREVNFVVKVFDPTYSPVNVTFTVHPYADFDAASVVSAAQAAVVSYLDPLAWGNPDSGEETRWLNNTKVRLFEIVQVLSNVEGVDYVTAVTINGSAADLTLTGTAPLPIAGTITGSSV